VNHISVDWRKITLHIFYFLKGDKLMDEAQKKKMSKLLLIGGAIIAITWIYNKGRNDQLLKICNKATVLVIKTRFEK